MVEIFTVRIGQDEAAARTVGNEIKLSGPSNVYFGAGDAGIAYYEKSGADLRVTLLDGQEILVRDFFVIGEMGEYSRLLDGGSAGEIEVTGLIAPEPFVPETDAAPVVAAADERADPVESMADGTQAQNGEVVIEVMGEGDAQPVEETAEATGGGITGGGFGLGGGLGFDQVLFFAAFTPALISVFDSEGGDRGTPTSSAAAAPIEEVPADADEEPAGEGDSPAEDGAAGTDGGVETAGAEDDSSLIALLTDLLAPDGGTSLDDALFGVADISADLGDFLAGAVDPLNSLLDDLQSASQSA